MTKNSSGCFLLKHGVAVVNSAGISIASEEYQVHEKRCKCAREYVDS